ncbi:MAG: endonuclease/exonuclease/phosphatase family protein [Verrucomicrobiales bacterium]
MISRVGVWLRWLRRKLSRTHWAARLFGIPEPDPETDQPGMIMIQIDGLSRTQFERACRAGNLPFLSRLIERQHFTLETFYSGMPSTTPAVQAEIFYGVRAAVPSFQFLRRESGGVLRMFESSAAEEIEAALRERCPAPLLEDAHAYSNIYRAGAARSRYCSQDFAPDEILKHLHPFKSLILAVIYAPKIVRMTALAILELGLAVVDAFRGLYARRDFVREILFVPTRVAVCIVLRELIRFRVMLDIERGIQLVHANFIGYDEQSHRRGPDSAFAHWTLLGIDRAVRDIFRAAHDAGHRDYELIIYSDHGQERSTPFEVRHGRPVGPALAEVFARGPLAEHRLWIRRGPEMVGDTLGRCRSLLGLGPTEPVLSGTPHPKEQIVVAAMGPVGHVYLPLPVPADQLSTYARAIVATAGVPLVLLHGDGGNVRAFNGRGAWELPADRAEVLGAKHPFLDEVADDLVRLCRHPDAGDFILSGWDPRQAPLSFPMENGAHGGPGFEETRGFLLVPDRIRRWHVSHLAKTRRRVRGEELRTIALHFLGRGGARTERVVEHPSRDPTLPVRVMTYNIHSCIGTDGKIRPERVARAINHCDPDVVAIQEIDAHRPRTDGHDQAQVIADHLRMDHVFHAMFEEAKERYGIAVFSRYPFEQVKADFLTEFEPRGTREARGAIWLRVRPPGHAPFHFINTHFGLGRADRRRQVEKLLGDEWLGAIPDAEPVILCGDLNSRPRSEVCGRIKKRLRDVQESLDGHRPLATFWSGKPLLRIDHVFVSGHFEIHRIERPDTATAAVASDHLPLCAELSLPAEP